ncbi:hypothetical protein DB347_04280 [Opitutaceae bacterium EW11]|nr:hypothetical protein DB347_04280 [Opitutaceae bacterium EW11]
MSPPCSSFFTPDASAAAAAASNAALPGAGASRPADPNAPTFDTVLAQAGDTPAAAANNDSVSTPAASEDKAADEKLDTDTAPAAPLTPEQIVLMASLGISVPAAAVATQPQPAPAAQAGDSDLTPVGAAGRSVPQMLAQGVAVLEYNLPGPVQNPAASAQSTDGKAAGAAVVDSAAANPASAPAVATAQLPASATPGVAAPAVSANQDPTVATAAATPAPTTPARAVTNAYGVKEAASAQKTQPNLPTSAAPQASDASTTPSPAADPTVPATPASSAAQPDAPVVATAAATASAPAPAKASQRPGEKLAEEPASTAVSGGKTPGVRGKNASLTTEDKEVKATSARVGTTAANWGKPMFEESRKTPSAAAEVQFGTPALSSPAATEFSATPSTSPATQTHASQLVHEIREIADGLWAVDRNSVEVKFNFGENDRLSVRVEYRDGAVQATFRTDSPEIRDIIAREWQTQSSSAERPYRVADPLFSSSSGFSLGGGDTSRQQRQAESSVPFERLAVSGSVRNAPSTTASSASAQASRLESAGYLHAIA